MKLIQVVLAGFLATASVGVAQDGSPENGKTLAEEYCANCHDIAPGGAFKMHPPSFTAIAIFRPMDQILGRIWFPSMHSMMPQMLNLLNSDNVADLTAYIMSLEPAE